MCTTFSLHCNKKEFAVEILVVLPPRCSCVSVDKGAGGFFLSGDNVTGKIWRSEIFSMKFGSCAL